MLLHTPTVEELVLSTLRVRREVKCSYKYTNKNVTFVEGRKKIVDISNCCNSDGNYLAEMCYKRLLNSGHAVLFLVIAAQVCWSLGPDFLGVLFFADEWPYRCLW